MTPRILPSICISLVVICAGCDRRGEAKPSPRTVVAFTALDRIYSEPILQAFERKTGIHVEPVYDAESAKTTGLINRLLARRDSPECDVLWNNEIVQTESLAEQNVLAAYDSPSARRIPEQYRDPDRRWTGFAARVRILIYNTNKFRDATPPTGSSDFTDPRFRGQAAIAQPYYGTTFTHVSMLAHRWGDARLKQWLDDACDNGCAIAPGNGAVRDLVASGERSFGLTDTDDAHSAMLDHKPIKAIIPDSKDGAVLIPNTVALIRNAPHESEAKALIDYLLSPEVERELARMPGAQFPLGTDLGDVQTPWTKLLAESPPQEMPVKQIATRRKELIELLRQTKAGR
ncbi:MAG TPA: extracellular solute-binding protein [Tepidisphaeraceae bacterium]|jgi:iron(III) transport system substrate-binding protein|nr:extracellular solute-binding protein [Tepidisphaeraceae bacterium]